jgi:phenylacetate-CoA ligase
MKPILWNRKLLEQTYWNKPAETMNREQLDQLHLKKIKSLLKFAYNNSQFYQKKWNEIGFRPEDVKTLADFKTKVPTTDKKDFLHYQEEFPPYGLTQALGEDFLAHQCKTSGSTGSPLKIPLSMYDTEKYGESWIYGWWALGIRPTDSFYFAFGFGAYAGFWSAYWGARRLGVKIIPGGGEDTEGHVKNILSEKPTVLICTPSYALRIAEKAKEMGYDLSQSSIKYTYHAGEPGPCSIEFLREQLDRGYGAVSGELLGVAELDAIAPGCPHREGVHMNEMNSFSWSMDPQTGKEVGDGEIGENIITTFVNTAQPLINYTTHDLVKAYSNDINCGCGRTWRYLEKTVLGRSDDMITVKATNVYPTAVENLIRRVEGVSEYFQMILTRDANGLDQMSIRMEPKLDTHRNDWKTMEEKVQNIIKVNIGLRMDIEIVENGSIPRTDLKFKRIMDLRPKEIRRHLDRLN